MKVRFVDLDDKFTYNSDIGILDQRGVRRHLALVQPLIRYLLKTLFILERWNWNTNLLLFWEEKLKQITHFYLEKKKLKHYPIFILGRKN